MKRIFYYALGGGLGHLTRSLATIHTLPVRGPVRLAVSTAEAAAIEAPENVKLISPPTGLDPSNRRLVADWIASAASEFGPDEWLVDCFPAGVLGELMIGDSDIRKTLVTRRVEWEAYLGRTPAISRWPRFSRIYATEPLGDRQIRDLETIGPKPEFLELHDFCGPISRKQIQDILEEHGYDSWLVIHSGPAEETEKILARAEADCGGRHPLLLITPEAARPRQLPPNVVHRTIFPVWPLFDQVDRIYTAAGANAIRQLAPFGDRHVAVPVERPLDDQLRRFEESEFRNRSRKQKPRAEMIAN